MLVKTGRISEMERLTRLVDYLAPVGAVVEECEIYESTTPQFFHLLAGFFSIKYGWFINSWISHDVDVCCLLYNACYPRLINHHQ